MLISISAGFLKGWSFLSELTRFWSAWQSGTVPLYGCIQRSHPITSLIGTVAKNQSRSKEQTLSRKKDRNIFKSNVSAQRKN